MTCYVTAVLIIDKIVIMTVICDWTCDIAFMNKWKEENICKNIKVLNEYKTLRFKRDATIWDIELFKWN
jgi:hypothetical protein